MPNRRTQRIGEEIKRLLGQMLTEGEIKDSRIRNCKGLITITAVEVVRDLKYATVYVSVMGGSYRDVIDGFKSASGYLRKLIGENIDLRYTPELIFKEDHSTEQAIEMSKKIDELKEKEEMKSGE